MSETIARNARWLLAIQAVKAVSQLVTLTVLARILLPSDFGLVSMATIATNLAMVFKDMGTASSIIRDKNLTQEKINAIHWINIGVGAAISLLLCCMALPLTKWYQEPALLQLLLLAATPFLISSFGTVPQAILERDSQFRLIAIVEITAIVISVAAAIVAGSLGAGALSIVFQAILYACTSTVLLQIFKTWSSSPPKFKGNLGDTISFSKSVVGFNIVNYMARNFDSLIIGRYLGAAPLGQYSLAYRIMLLPMQYLTFVATRSMYPIFSKKQDDNAAIKELYLAAVTVVATLTALALTTIWVLRERLVISIFGAGWGVVPELLTYLIPVGFIQSIVSTSGAVFLAKGQSGTMFRLGILNSSLQVVGVLLGMQWGIVGIAVAYLATNCLNSLPVLYQTMKAIDGRLLEIERAIRPATVSSLITALAVSGTDVLNYLPQSTFGESALVFAALLFNIAINYVFFRKTLLRALQTTQGKK